MVATKTQTGQAAEERVSDAAMQAAKEDAAEARVKRYMARETLDRLPPDYATEKPADNDCDGETLNDPTLATALMAIVASGVLAWVIWTVASWFFVASVGGAG